MAAGAVCTFDHVTPSTRFLFSRRVSPPQGRSPRQSSGPAPRPSGRGAIVDFLVDRGEIVGISFMACCIATCAMIPAAPARSAGLVSSEPGLFANWTNALIWPLFPFTTPVLRPVSGFVLGPCFWISWADSLVSFTQLPELAAISEPACVTAAPVRRPPRRPQLEEPVTPGTRRVGVRRL